MREEKARERKLDIAVHRARTHEHALVEPFSQRFHVFFFFFVRFGSSKSIDCDCVYGGFKLHPSEQRMLFKSSITITYPFVWHFLFPSCPPVPFCHLICDSLNGLSVSWRIKLHKLPEHIHPQPRTPTQMHINARAIVFGLSVNGGNSQNTVV